MINEQIIILAKIFAKASKRNSKFCPFQYNIKEVICGLASYEKFIFSHDFAKAFWGEEIICKDGSKYEDYEKGCLDAGMTKEEIHYEWEIDEEYITLPIWQYHIKQLALAKDRLKYLEKFLEKK